MCLICLIIAFIGISAYDINKSLDELSKNLDSLSQQLGEFIVSQVLINNRPLSKLISAARNYKSLQLN